MEIAAGASAAGTPCLLMRVYRQLVAVDCGLVRELVTGAEVTAVPRMPDWMRGVFNWRGKIVPCVDLRRRLGLPSVEDELAEVASVITARAADHMEWMEELSRSVEERRPFRGTTDPHACAFGRWYDAYRTDNLVVASQLRKLDLPHKAIHALAGRIEQLKAEGRHEAAARLVREHRDTTLARLLDLMANFEQVLRDSHRPVTVVVSGRGGWWAGLEVDGVEAVAAIAPQEQASMEDRGVPCASDLLRKLVLRGGDGAPLFWLEAEALLGEAAAAPAA